MKIYFKFLNDFILIDDNEDNINGDIPSHFVEFIDKNSTEFSGGFIKIQHSGIDYFVHISQLQWTN